MFAFFLKAKAAVIKWIISSLPHFFLIASPGGLGSMKPVYLATIHNALPRAEVVILSPAGFSSVFSRQFYQDKASDKWWLKCTSHPKGMNMGKCTKFVTRNLITFSAGYGYPREFFKVGGVDFFDTYLSIDSIHGSKRLNHIKQFERFATDKKLFLIHTDIDPYTYASTTDVKNHLQSRGLNFYTYHVPGNDKWAHIRALREAGPKVLREVVIREILEGKL